MKHTDYSYLLYRYAGTLFRGGGYLSSRRLESTATRITALGEAFLAFDGSLDGDVGRSWQVSECRKRMSAMKEQWLEVVRVSKSGQTMRVYRQLQELLDFCLQAGLVDFGGCWRRR
jgi:hypothetical protein